MVLIEKILLCNQLTTIKFQNFQIKPLIINKKSYLFIIDELLTFNRSPVLVERNIIHEHTKKIIKLKYIVPLVYHN